MPKSTGARNRFRALQVIGYIDVKNVQIKIKNVKKRKKRDKNKKNVCKSNKKRYLFLL